MPRPIITSRFANIAIIAWAVPLDLLADALPDGLEPDPAHHQLIPLSSRPNDFGVVSLIAYTSDHTRVWGLSLPGQSTFSEIALRIHCRQGSAKNAPRGVFNIKRFISRRLPALVASRLYHEHASLQRVSPDIRQLTRSIDATYRIRFQPPMLIPGPGQVAKPDGVPGDWSFSVNAAKPWRRPDIDSVETWLKESRWVFSRALDSIPVPTPNPSAQPTTTTAAPSTIDRGGAMCHEILHPTWSCFPVTHITLDIDLGNLFGSRWSSLAQQPPAAGVLAVGSSVAIFARKPIVRVLTDSLQDSKIARSPSRSKISHA